MLVFIEGGAQKSLEVIIEMELLCELFEWITSCLWNFDHPHVKWASIWCCLTYNTAVS